MKNVLITGASGNLGKATVEKFLAEVPAVESDFVLAHASVDGFDSTGTRRMLALPSLASPDAMGPFARLGLVDAVAETAVESWIVEPVAALPRPQQTAACFALGWLAIPWWPLFSAEETQCSKSRVA